LAIALANQQLDLLPTHDRHRQAYAAYIQSKLSSIPFLEMPSVRNSRQDKHAWYAFVMQFNSRKAPKGLTREEFVRRLTEDHGLKEVDIPKSTGLLNDLPLFTHPHEAVPRFGSEPWYKVQPTVQFPKAGSFYKRAIKLPMWATAKDKPIVEHYVKSFLAVAEEVMTASFPQEVRRSGGDRIQARL
jgi:dTDP-4-amino-4,6-dideoxygalactose transaminase